MKLAGWLLMVVVAVMMASCGGSPEFRIDAASDDIGTQNVTFRYLDSDGAYRSETVTAVDGKFSYLGHIGGSTYVEVLDANGKLLGEFIADRGDNIKARFSVQNPENISIRGNKDSELLMEFMDKNRGSVIKGDTEGLNAAIDAFIRQNPKQFASTALLMQYFTVAGHEEQALELLQTIGEKYRPSSRVLGFEQMLNQSLSATEASIDSLQVFSRRDTAEVFTVRGAKLNLLIVSDNETRAADSVVRLISTSTSPGLRIVDLGCDRDTLLWGVSLRGLPDDYPSEVVHYWLPAGYATAELAATAPSSVPFFIVADSLGHVLHRTPSTASVRQFLIHRK